MPKYTDLIGIPYRENGRDRNGLDCYGLVLEMCYRNGTPLRDIAAESKAAKADEYALELNLRKTTVVKSGTILEIHIKNELHIGFALNDKLFIHATKNQGVRISPIAAYPVSNFYEVTPWE